MKKKSIKDKKILDAKNFNELIEIEYGKKGTNKRTAFENNAELFIVSEMLKNSRKEAKLTQEQLAFKLGTQKSYISRIETGKSDIQLSTLFKIIETGLGKKLSIQII